MTIPTLSGNEEITKVLNSVMFATIDRLRVDKILTEEQYKECLDNYLAVYVRHDGGFINWVKRHLIKSDIVLIVKTN